MRVLLISESFPFDGPDTPFLVDEIAALGSRHEVLIAPATTGHGPLLSLPPHVSVTTGLADARVNGAVRATPPLRALFSPTFYREVGRQAPLSLRPRSVATIAARLTRARTAERWMEQFLRTKQVEQLELVYSWWSLAEAYGIARALRGTGIPFVARAHGYDLFAEQEAVGFVPFQARLISESTRVFSASKAGSDYLHGRYPELADKVETAYLGTLDPGAFSAPSSDGVLRIVTCSTNTEVKRVDLLATALARLATKHPEIEFHWTHLGSGPLSNDLDSLLASLPILSGRTSRTGSLDPPQVKDWYRSHEVDLFMNVSSSEGLPVSLMEAASFGIPMMATRVGGNSEIVNVANGILLPADPSGQDIAEAIARFARMDPAVRSQMRVASRETFLSTFNAEVNYPRFAELLSDLQAS